MGSAGRPIGAIWRGAVALGLLGFALPVAPAAGAELITLDSSDARNGDHTQAAASSLPLASGEAYVVTVSGTTSIWPPEAYVSGTCGVPEPAPMEPSPGRGPTLAGWDAETVWAGPNGGSIFGQGRICDTLTGPVVTRSAGAGFQMATGPGPWNRPTPVGGARTAPRPDHTYSYEVTGAGEPLRFRFADQPATDNSGVFSIAIRTQAECAATNCLNATVPLTEQFGVPTVAPSPVSAAPAATSAPAAAPPAAGVPLAQARTCPSSRVLSLRLAQPRGVRFATTTYFLDGKRARTVKGAKIYLRPRSGRIRVQKFRGLRAGTVQVRAAS